MSSSKLGYWMIPVLLISFWLSVRQVDRVSLWSDEIATISYGRGERNHPFTIPQIWANVAQKDPWQPPGWPILWSIAGRWINWVPAAMRVFPILFGLLAMAFTYRLGRDWLSPLVGLFAAILLATSAVYVRYLYELRAYSLIALESALMVWVYLRIINRPRSQSRWPLLVLFLGTIAAFYIHYLTAVPIIALGLYHLLFVPKTRRWWQVTIALAAGAMTFLPWLSIMLTGIGKASAAHRTTINPGQVVLIFLNMFSNGVTLVSALLIAAALTALRNSAVRRYVFQLVFISAISLVLIIVINQVANIISAPTIRYLMPLWPLFALFVAVGIARFRRWPVVMAAVLLLCIGIGFKAIFSDFTDIVPSSAFPIQHVADELTTDRAQNGDIVVHYLPDDMPVPDRYRYRGTGELYYGPTHADTEMADGRMGADDEKDLVEKLQDYGRVWMAYLPDNPPSSMGRLVADLADDFHHCGTLTERLDVTIDLYARSDIPCPNNPGLYLDGRAPA